MEARINVSANLFPADSASTQKNRPGNLRRLIYPLALLCCLTLWIGYMHASANWHLLRDHWPMSLTMVLGSFVAGATPQGGGAIAYPVFTKVLQIPAHDSRTFGLMIQSVGMTMASILILARGVRILPQVVLVVSLSSMVGLWMGTFYLLIPPPYPRILFTLGATSFGVVLAGMRLTNRRARQDRVHLWTRRTLMLFIITGVLGGILAAQTGSGADMTTFIVLTLFFGVDEKVSIPTTVIIMALTSIFGFYLHGAVVQDVGLVWHYWLAAVPVVAVGAPLGAWTVTRIPRDPLLLFILLLILLDLISTVLTTRFP